MLIKGNVSLITINLNKIYIFDYLNHCLKQSIVDSMVVIHRSLPSFCKV